MASVNHNSVLPALGLMCASSLVFAEANTIGAQWQNYIAAQVQRAAGVEVEVVKTGASSTEELIQSALQREIRLALKLSDTSSVRLDIREGSPTRFDVTNLGLVGQSNSLARQYAPTIVQRTGFGEFQVGAIFTYENFSSRLGAKTALSNEDKLFSNASTGSAVHLAWLGKLSENTNLSAGYRSTMRMDAFQNYRGLFAEPGRFDTPAEVSAGLQMKLSPDQTLNMSVDRVNYSSVAPFSSRLLPDSFVSLLGDGASPDFQWQDLTVYRASFDQRFARGSVVSIGVSSSLQPDPTSAVLSNALSETRSDYTVSLGLEQSVGSSSKFRFGASYAPFEYFLGPTLLSANRDYTGARLEAEALLEVRF